MKTYLVLIPDGVGLRNFLLTGFLNRLAGAGRVVALHNMADDALDLYARPMAPRVRWLPLIPYTEAPLARLARESLAAAHMYGTNTEALRLIRGHPVQGGSWKSRAVAQVARGIGMAARGPGGIRALQRWHARLSGGGECARRYGELLREFRPDVVFCTNQRPSTTAPAIYAARAAGIATATFIFSWDNLTSKARMAAEYDHYFVWGDRMSQELMQIYPEVRAQQVHVTGTPQFDSHTDPRLALTRSDFCRTIGADPTRPLICYSGGDTKTCPEDPHYVRLLLEGIRRRRIAGRPQVLLRPTPVDGGERYGDVLREYPELIRVMPEWLRPAGRDWSGAIPLPSDVQVLANLTRHTDVNVNVASTMTIDFALQDTPVVNVAFDAVEPPARGIPLWDYYYRFDHYRPVIELGAARIARSVDQLYSHVSDYLANPSLDREARQRLVKLEIGVPPGQSCRAVLSALQTIAQTDEALLPLQ